MTSNKKRILIVSESHLIKTFSIPTIERLKEEANVTFDCFVVNKIDSDLKKQFSEIFANIFVNESLKGFIGRIPKFRFFKNIYGLRKLASRIPEYDIVHVNFHHYYYSFFIGILRSKTKKLYLTFYGSDFNGIENIKHFHNRISVKRCDGIFVTENLSLLLLIIEKYKIDTNKTLTGVLFPLFGSISKFDTYLKENSKEDAKRSWEVQDLLMVCGYSAAPITQHEQIIDVLAENINTLSRFKIIFPMTYGHLADKTRKNVRSKLLETNIVATVLDTFLPVEQLQALRLATDIFIHIQSRDQMAASMLEHLAAGSVVITGKWLPYQELLDIGMYMIILDSPNDLKIILSEIVNDLHLHQERSKVNRDLVFKMMCWENIRNNWHKYYQLESRL